MVKMNRDWLLLNNKSAYTLFEMLVVLVLIGVVSAVITSSLFSTTQTDYEIWAEAHNVKSSIRFLQAKATQYFEQKLYIGTEMRDDDLWGIQFYQGKPLQLVRKEYHSNRVEKLDDLKHFDLPELVWWDSDNYPSHKNTITYSLKHPCFMNQEIFFNALGKPVNREGRECSRNGDIVIQLTAPNTNQKVALLINKTGHVTIKDIEENL